MTVSIHLPERLVVVHTEPDLNRNLNVADSLEALDAVELVRQVLTEHVARHGGELPVRGTGIRWHISDSPLGG